ncbi:MAG: hypothetical protein ACK4KT_00075 [Thermaurantimonas sp.]
MESLIGLLFLVHIYADDSCFLIMPADSVANSLISVFKSDTSFESFDDVVYRIDSVFKKNNYPFYVINKIDNGLCTGLCVRSGPSIGDSVKVRYASHPHQPDEVIDLKAFDSRVRKILEEERNAGFPFSRITPVIQSFSNGLPVIEAELDKGPMIIIDSLVIKSENVPKLHFIYRYSGLKLPLRYNGKKIEESIRNLENSGVLELTAPASILYSEKGSTLYLYLKKKQRVFADLVIGVNSNDRSQTILTGEMHLALKNVFGNAESIALQWRAPAQQQQFLNLQVDFPFVFRTPLGWSANVRLFRQDSTFATFSGDVTARYFFSPAISAGFGFQRESSSAPGALQADINSFTSDYSFVRLLYKKMNGSGVYRTGVSGNGDVGVGLLRNRDNEINRFKFQIILESEQILSSNHKIYNRFSMFHLGGEDILLNESFRTGGVGSIRGFNEWLFFATTAVIGVAEYRFFLDSNTFLKAFYDGAWQKISSGEGGYFQGVGTGLALPVGNGIFHIDVGVGKFPGLPLNLRDTRLHIGVSAGF